MKRSHNALAAIALAAAIGASSTGSIAAQAAKRVKSGLLSCDISGGISMIIASKKQLTCQLIPSGPGPREVYVGIISKSGLNIGTTTGGRMEWAVHAPATRPIGALVGRYTGVSAEATAGVGAGGNVLLGGSDHTISLQPISVEGQTDLNVAASVTELELRPAR